MWVKCKDGAFINLDKVTCVEIHKQYGDGMLQYEVRALDGDAEYRIGLFNDEESAQKCLNKIAGKFDWMEYAPYN